MNSETSAAREIRILHIYGDAMDLYGDAFNLVCIRQALAKRFDIQCRVDVAGVDDVIDPTGCDMVYMGHGKARNLEAVSTHFVRYGEALRAAVEKGTLFLVTGCARMLFGREFTTLQGVVKPGIGLFDDTGYDTGEVFTSDVVGRLLEDGQEQDFLTYGFVNRTCHLIHGGGKNPYPMFRVLQGAGDGPEPDGFEGTRYRNFFGTWQMGPLLARNPALLEQMLRVLLGEDYRPPETVGLEQEALELTLREFQLGNV